VRRGRQEVTPFRSTLRLRPALLLLGALGGGACDAPTPAAEPVSARAFALSSLDDEELALLPRALLDRPIQPPTAPTPATSAIPEWDRPFLKGLDSKRSYSVGTASRGYLVNAVEMPRDLPYLRPRPTAIRKDALWGTQEMVGLVIRVAKKVADVWPGSELWAGDFSSRHGGDLTNHASHNSGRDVDLAFYMRDRAGRMADSARMLPIAASGRARWTELDFDVPRNWALVEAMVRDPNVQVQYIFIAKHLEALLVAHAKRTGVDPAVVERVATVLREPVHAANHEDHYHVRLYCALHERVEGCVNYGVTHTWADHYDKAISERVGEALPFLRTGGPREIRYAVTRIVRLRARGASEHLEPLLKHRDETVRALAEDAIAFLDGRRTPPRWSHLTEEDPGE